MDKTKPKPKIRLGNLQLVELDEIAKTFDMTRKCAGRFLKALHVKAIHIGRGTYINQNTLERVLDYLSTTDGAAFAAPGSLRKNRRRKSEKLQFTVTTDMLAKINDPNRLAISAIASGKSAPQLEAIRGLLKQVGKSKKGDKNG